LNGKTLKPDLIDEAAQLASDEAKPITDFRASAAYRKELVRNLVARGIKPGRFHNLRRIFLVICVICLPCEMRSLFLWGEICGLKLIRKPKDFNIHIHPLCLRAFVVKLLRIKTDMPAKSRGKNGA
jgi:hypothetical protein